METDELTKIIEAGMQEAYERGMRAGVDRALAVIGVVQDEVDETLMRNQLNALKLHGK